MVYGHCGYSPAPISDLSRSLSTQFVGWWKTVEPEWDTLREYFGLVEKKGIATNVVSFAGHGFVRAAVMVHENRAPTGGEMEEMKALVAEAMEDGAMGLSTGLGYPPGCYAETEEITELCKVVAKYGGIYTTHTRGGSRKSYLPGIIEAIEIGERSGCPVQISHIETHYDAWGLQEEALKLVDKARRRGTDVTCDVCVHMYGASWLAGSVMPEWAFQGGAEKMLERLRDPATREKMKTEIIKGRGGAPLTRDGLWDHLLVLSGEKHPEFRGKHMDEIAEEWNKDPWEAAYDLLLDEGSRCAELTAAMRSHNEEDLRRAIVHPCSMPETDFWAVAPYGELGETHPHPRAYATVPLVFRKYVRGETLKELPLEVGAKILTMEEAIRKMTSLPAQRLGLRDRGLIREGMWADITVFNEEKITDKATYLEPHQYPEGMPYIIVNGTIIVDEGEHTGALPGKILRGPGYRHAA